MQIKYPWGKDLVFMEITFNNEFAQRKGVVDLANARYPVVFERLKACVEYPNNPLMHLMYHPTTSEAVYWAWYDVHNMGRKKKRHPSLKETRHVQLLEMAPRSRLRYMVHQVDGAIRCGALYLAVFDEYRKYHPIKTLWAKLRTARVKFYPPVTRVLCDICSEPFEANEEQYSHGHPDERLHKGCRDMLQGMQKRHEEILAKREKTPVQQTSDEFPGQQSSTIH